MVRREDADKFPAIAVHGNGCDQAERQGHEGALADALADAAVLAGAVVLGRIDGHAMPKEIMGCKASCSIFVADTKPAMVSGPKVLQTDWRTRMPMEMMRNWTAMGRPRRRCCQAKAVEGPVGPGQAQHGKTAAHETQAEYGRNGLSDDQAMAEPGTPQPKTTMNSKARAMFKRDDTMRK